MATNNEILRIWIVRAHNLFRSSIDEKEGRKFTLSKETPYYIRPTGEENRFILDAIKFIDTRIEYLGNFFTIDENGYKLNGEYFLSLEKMLAFYQATCLGSSEESEKAQYELWAHKNSIIAFKQKIVTEKLSMILGKTTPGAGAGAASVVSSEEKEATQVHGAAAEHKEESKSNRMVV